VFGIGPSELIIILVIALLVLGPKRLPELAAGLGKGLAEFRRATADINAELDEARRSLEDQAREAARQTQPEPRVSRNERTTPRNVAPSRVLAAEAVGTEHDEHPHEESPEAKAPTDPKASA
jgi:TatA/E family protein of Tat protein translocase